MRPQTSWDMEQEYRRLADAFSEAKNKHPQELVHYHLLLAGYSVRLRIVGRVLAKALAPVWDHLHTSKSESCGFTIDLWDENATSTKCPLPGKAPSFYLEDGYALQRLAQSTSAINRTQGSVVGCAKDGTALSLYELGRPLHAALSIWHLDRARPLVHAGCFRSATKAALVGGCSGSGKTTVCVQAALNGFSYLGDDLIALEQTTTRFVAHSLYASTFLLPSDLTRLQGLGPIEYPRYPNQDKALGYVPGRKLSSCALDAVLLPSVQPGEATRLVPARSSEVLMGLAPSTLGMGMLSPGVPGFELLGNLASAVPGYHLNLGDDADQVLPSLLEQL